MPSRVANTIVLVEDEVTDYTIAPYARPTSNEIKNAAHTLYDWTRQGATTGPTATASLNDSIPEWKKIP